MLCQYDMTYADAGPDKTNMSARLVLTQVTYISRLCTLTKPTVTILRMLMLIIGMKSDVSMLNI